MKVIAQNWVSGFIFSLKRQLIVATTLLLVGIVYVPFDPRFSRFHPSGLHQIPTTEVTNLIFLIGLLIVGLIWGGLLSTTVVRQRSVEESLSGDPLVGQLRQWLAHENAMTCLLVLPRERQFLLLEAFPRPEAVAPPASSTTIERTTVADRTTQPEAENWYGTANRLLAEGRFFEAKEAYDRALQIDLGFARAWFGLGKVFAELSQYSEAVTCFQKALKLASASETELQVEAWIGIRLLDSGRTDEALSFFRTKKLDLSNMTKIDEMLLRHRTQK